MAMKDPPHPDDLIRSEIDRSSSLKWNQRSGWPNNQASTRACAGEKRASRSMRQILARLCQLWVVDAYGQLSLNVVDNLVGRHLPSRAKSLI